MKRMQTMLVSAFVFASAVPAWSQPVPIAPPPVAPAPLRFPDVVREAQALVQQDQATKGYPGIAVAVSVDGQTVWSEGFGYADLEHRLPMTPSIKFRVGSVAKPMTAAAVVTLYEEGRLDLDVPIQQYVPTFPEKSHPITARQLGGHLAGIRHYEGDENFIRDPYATVVDSLAIFKDDPLLHDPGSAYSYSSYGFNLLSAVVEGASGHDFLTYMRDVVFRPLGMNEVLPTAKEDPHPFEGQRTQGRVMVVAPAPLLIVVAARPHGEADRLVRVFVKRLLEELRTGQAVMHPEGFAAAFGHGRDAGVGLELGRRVPARAVGPEGGRQAGRADSPGAGETREQRVIRVGGEDGGDLGIEGVDGPRAGDEVGRRSSGPRDSACRRWPGRW